MNEYSTKLKMHSRYEIDFMVTGSVIHVQRGVQITQDLKRKYLHDQRVYQRDFCWILGKKLTPRSMYDSLKLP